VQITTACLQSSTVRILLHSTDINTEQQESELGEIILYSAFAILMTVKSEDTINKYQSKTPNAISSSMQIPHFSSSFSVAETQPAPSHKFCRSFSFYTFQDMASDLYITGREDVNWMKHEGEYSGSKTHKTFLISNFRRILYVVCFLLGNSAASEFYMPTFRNTLSVPSS